MDTLGKFCFNDTKFVFLLIRVLTGTFHVFFVLVFLAFSRQNMYLEVMCGILDLLHWCFLKFCLLLYF